MTIVLLDDDTRRLQAMQRQLAKAGSAAPHTFRTAPRAVEWFANHPAEATLISLDHDLERDPTDPEIDPGTGRDVADFIATQTPNCPIIIHSSPAAIGMDAVLTDAGWQVHLIAPYEDLRWIRQVWIDEVRRQLDAAGNSNLE